MGRRKRVELPAAGAAFAVRLADGRYSACRVLIGTDGEWPQHYGRVILVAGSAWIGDEVPEVTDPALRPILRLTHHNWKDIPNVLCVSDAPPPEFIPIGVVAPTAEECQEPRVAFGAWANFAYHALMQWRWDHDRDAVLAEDAARKEQEAEALRRSKEEYRARLKRMTLEDLRARRFFAGWKGDRSPAATRASRKIMADTVDALLQLGPAASEAERLAVLQWCIGSFNTLDAKRQFIDTAERDDICEEFEIIVHACGMHHHKDLADRWREW